MNPLVLLSLVAVATAAPGGIFRSGAVTLSNVGPSGVVSVAQPGAVAYSAVHQVHQVVPAVQQVVQQVHVPVTKTVHYETKPVVTGYSTSIIKPAIPHLATPQLAIPAPVQQVVVQEQQPVVAVAQPAPVVTNDAVIVESRSAAVPVAPAVNQFYTSYAQGPVSYAAAPIVAPAPVAVVRQAQAADFEPLVTKEQVLAPVRTHTQITPQFTQIQPEVTVRRVIQNVDVQTPVAVHTPVIHQVAQPVVQNVAVARSAHVVGVNHHGLALGGHHQFVL